ncbi:MAG: glycosyltransferase family 2 protein [Patescibacteria group bacterium]|nr:glycosyltransferase family 2 protein [Patescibacteria group bacterium]
MSKPTTQKEKRFYRFLEIWPGAIVWATYIAAIGLSFFKPLWVIYFIIAFSIYWVMRILYLLIYNIYSWIKMRQTVKVDWLSKLKEEKNWQDYYHLIFLPTYKEGIEILRESFKHLTQTDYPSDKFIIVLGGEERDKENFLQIAEQIKKEFSEKIFKMLITVHPKGLPDEIPGKGSNVNWMGHQAKKLIDELNLDYEKIIVSTFDIDTCVHPTYFAHLTYKYINHPNPTRASYQPIAVYHNNIWEAPAVLRVVANSTTFWLLSELARPERLFTFSSHSMSFRALVDVGFWEKDIVTEDSRIFLQCFIHYKGEYSVEPMFIPVSMDTVMSDNLWQSFKNQYKQIQRWGWAVEHFPYMVWNFFKNPQGKQIPWLKKMRYLFQFTEGEYSWPTAPILLLVLGRLPLFLADPATEAKVIAQNAPYVLQWIMTCGVLGLIILAILSTIILPKRLHKSSKFGYVIMIVQWILVPITMIIFGSIPAVDAQTRLMLGKNLGFRVTEKKRKQR